MDWTVPTNDDGIYVDTTTYEPLTEEDAQMETMSAILK